MQTITPAPNRNRLAILGVSLALATSALLGTTMLMTDGYLWAAAPSHAYGLLAFVVLDAGLAIAVWRITGFGLLGSALLGIVQFGAMLGDLFTGEPAGLPLQAWQQYILGDGYFVALLLTQLGLVSVSLVAIRYLRSASFARLIAYLHAY